VRERFHARGRLLSSCGLRHRCDTAEELPVRALIARVENVTVGSAEVHFFGVAGIGCQGNYGAAWRADLTPRLSAGGETGRHGDGNCCKPFCVSFCVHINVFSQSAQALTTPSVGNVGAEIS